MELQVITNRCFGLFMRRNVSISRNRTKIERLLDWKEFPSKSVGRFSFQCLTAKEWMKMKSQAKLYGPIHKGLVLKAYASSEGSNEAA